MEPCSLVADITAQPLGVQWPVYVEGSACPPRSGPPPPFGFLRREPERRKPTDVSDVYLHILPWNFPKLAECLTLFHKSTKNQHDTALAEKARHEWYTKYLPSVPAYYGNVSTSYTSSVLIARKLQR